MDFLGPPPLKDGRTYQKQHYNNFDEKKFGNPPVRGGLKNPKFVKELELSKSR